MASEVMKLIFAVLDVSFNSGHYTVIIKRQFFYIWNFTCSEIHLRNMTIWYEALLRQLVLLITCLLYLLTYLFTYLLISDSFSGPHVFSAGIMSSGILYVIRWNYI